MREDDGYRRDYGLARPLRQIPSQVTTYLKEPLGTFAALLRDAEGTYARQTAWFAGGR